MPSTPLILDEGHRIKNADTQQTRQVKALQCRYRVLCTGTVVQNRLTELWCLMDFVCCGRLLGDRREFKELWSDVIEDGKHKGASVEARRMSEELSRKLKELIQPYIHAADEGGDQSNDTPNNSKNSSSNSWRPQRPAPLPSHHHYSTSSSA